MRIKTFIFSIGLLIGLAAFNASASVAEIYEQALQSYNDKKYREAYIYLQNILNEESEHLPSKVLMGKVLLNSGYILESIEELEESLSLGADLNVVVLELLQAYLASSEYEKVLNFDINQVNKQVLPDTLLYKANAADNLGLSDQAEALYTRALTLQPNSIRLLNSYTAFLLGQSRISQAKSTLAHSYALNSNDPRTMHLKGILANAENAFTEALEWFKAAQQKSPNDPIIQRALAFTYIRLQDIEAALPLVEKIIQATPNDPLMLLVQATLQSAKGERKESQASLDNLSNKLTLLSGLDQNSTARIDLIKGITAVMKENYSEGAIHLEQYLATFDNDERAITLLARTYITTNQNKKAKNLLEKNLSLVKQNAQLTSLLCQLYKEAGRFYFCQHLLENVDKSIQNSAAISNEKVKLMQTQGKYKQALTLFEQLFPPPLTVPQQVILVRLALQNNQFERALILTDELIQNTALDTSEFMLLKAEILLSENRLQETQRILELIAKNTPDDPLYKTLKAKYLLRIDQAEEAEAILLELIETFPENTEINLLLTSMYGQRGAYSDAINILRTFQRDYKNSIQISDALVKLYMQQKDYYSALEELNKLRSERFDNPKYIAQKISLLIQLNQNDKAKQEIYRLEQLLPYTPEGVQMVLDFKKRVGDLVSALNYIDRVSLEQPLTTTQLTHRAHLLMMTDQYSEASALLEKLIKANPSNSTALFLAGKNALLRGNPEKAFQLFSQGFDMTNGAGMFAQEMYEISRSGFAVDEFENQLLSQIQNTDRQQLHYLLGNFYVNQQRYDEATFHFTAYEQSGELSQRDAVLIQLSMLKRNEHPHLALKYSREAYNLAPKDPVVVAEHAWNTALVGQYQIALSLMREANTLAAHDGENLYRLGFILFKLKRCDEAEIELNKVRQLSNDIKTNNLAEHLLSEIKAVRC